MSLNANVYEFNSIRYGKHRNYIFQLIKSRRLTDVYHSHDFYELIWFLKGNGTQFINETVVGGEESTVILLKPTDRHCFLSQSEDVEVISLSVKKEEFELLSNAYAPFLLKESEKGIAPIRLAASLPPLWGDLEKTAESLTEYDCKLLLSCFLTAYAKSTDTLRHSSDLPPMLVSASREMEKAENLKKGISAFTALSHYSHSHLARLVRKHFGMSLKQYINELRLQSAYNAIILSNRSAEEIAEALGFLSFSHFNKIFKRRFSATPAALRKERGAWTT